MLNRSRRVGRVGFGRISSVAGVLAVAVLAVTAQAASASNPTYSLSAFAGTGTPGAATAGAATSSQLWEPYGAAVDSAGNLYIVDSDNNAVEKVTPSGTLSIIAGNKGYGAPTPGVATNSKLADPAGVAVDSSGNIYIADYGDHKVLKVTPSGTLSIIAGNGTYGAPVAGPATSSPLGEVWGVAVDSSGNVYIVDDTEQVIEKVTPSGTLSVFAGIAEHSGTPTPGPATSSHLHEPTGLAIDAAGNLYVADSENDVIEKITPSGTLSVFAGIVGSQAAPTPGPATSSALNEPFGVAVDAAGDIYIADTGNNEIEQVTPSGTLSVIAGNHTSGEPSYGVAATSSALHTPADVASTAAGRLYVADTYNNTVDLLAPPAPVATVAPSVTGTTTVGQTLTASLGTFTNSPVTYKYQWQDCDGSGANCTAISGATSSTYTLAASDAGHTIRVIVTACNGGGATASPSAQTAAITGLTSSSLSSSPVTSKAAASAALVTPSSVFTLSGMQVSTDGTIVTTVDVPGPGVVNLLGTHEEVKHGAEAAAVLDPGHRRLAWGRITLTTNAAGKVTVTLHPNRTGARLLARHRAHGWALNVKVWTQYTPAGGKPRRVAKTVKVLSAKRHA